MSKTLKLLFFYLFVFATLMGQQTTQYVFNHLTTYSGLASNGVFTVAQDKKGYIWIGTINGLQRYDGNKFLSFRSAPDNPFAIPNDNVQKLHVDKKGRLWVICAGNRVGIFNTSDFRFREVPVQTNEDVKRFISNFLEDKNGKLSIVFGKFAMVTYDENKREFSEKYNIVQWPRGWKPINIFIDTLRSQYWMSSDSGLVLYDLKTRNLNYGSHNPDNNYLIKYYKNIPYLLFAHMDRLGRFWLVSWTPLAPRPEVFGYDSNTKLHSSYEPRLYDDLNGYHEIYGFTEQKNGKLWLWGKPFVAEFQTARNIFQLVTNKVENDYSLHFDIANFFYEDREQNLWVSTNNGLFIFNPTAQLFSNIRCKRPEDKLSSEAVVFSALQPNQNEIWVSTWGDGIYSYDNDFKPLSNPISSQQKYRNLFVQVMHQRDNGDIWIGCQFGQFLVYNKDRGVVMDIVPSAFDKKTVKQIVEDKQGNIWLATQGLNGRLIKWNASGTKSFEDNFIVIDSFDARIHKLYVDKAGFIWVGTELYGAIKIDPHTGKIVQRFDQSKKNGYALMSPRATDFLQYDDSTMLIASAGVNILNLHTNKIEHFKTGDGLPSNNVYSIVKDKDGFVWLGMNNGLSRLNFNKRIVTTYSALNGIINDNFQIGASTTLNDGRILLGTNHDFLIFQPSEIAKYEKIPQIEITGFKLVDSYLPVDSLSALNKITVEYNQHPVSIEFSALSYIQQSQLTYYHKLEGIDADWVRTDNNHMVSYSFLPPGTYTFQVKCENGYGVSSTNLNSMVIVVRAPFWKTWWFYGLICLLAVSVLYWMDKERIKRLIALQEVRTQIADNLHNDVNTTLNNINLLSEIAKIKVDKDINKSKEYIDQINTKSRKMIDDMDDMLWSIDPENDSMQKTLERMNEFAMGLKLTHGCSIDLIVDPKVKFVKLSMKTRHDLFLIFKEALRNIAQNSSCTSSIVYIDLVKSTLSIKIQDKRTDFDIKSFEHNIQFDEMKKTAQAIKALLDIQLDTKGISIILQVPAT